jgi:hypothetical protein
MVPYLLLMRSGKQGASRDYAYSINIIDILRVLNKHPLVHFAPQHPNDRQEVKTQSRRHFST